MNLPMFVTISSLLFWSRFKWNDKKKSKEQLRHYMGRLVMRIIAWSIVLLPFWLHRFIEHYPNNWFVYIVPKLMLIGGCRGGYFIMSLIYGNTIIYLLHRYLGKIIPFILIFILHTYYNLASQGIIDDYLGLCIKIGFLSSDYLCIRFLFYMEACVWLIPWLAGKLQKANAEWGLWMSLAAFIAICAVPSDLVSYIATSCFVVLLCAFMFNLQVKQLPSWSVTMRNMSKCIFFIHFVVIDYGERALKYFADIKLVDYGPFIEYVVVMSITVPLAYLIASPLSRRIKLIKEWLL
ncbi:MAG: hypothetical protein IJR20_04560 [Muribaculaceae bacterium]|nr:hypothetical protein [Muribaculaceae bacterium]